MTATARPVAALKTKRLILRAPRPQDAEEIYCAINDWDIVKYLSRVPWPYTLGDAQDYLARSADEDARPREQVFVVDDGRVAGMASLRDLDTDCGTLGYWIAKRVWGRGYATESVRALADFAFRQVGVRAISADVVRDNPASMRVLEKVGFHWREDSTCSTRSRGEVPAKIFRLLGSDWAENQ